MRKLILMTSAAIIAPLSGFAEDITCTATPNCADLGYTSTTSCDNGVKCPWGDTYFCPPSEAEICEKNGFLYECKGTGYKAGLYTSCSGKYSECSCADGFEWNGTECIYNPWGKCTGIATNCTIGDILFSDGSCNADMVDGKIGIAVVTYKSSDGRCGQALALNSIGKCEWGSYKWGGFDTDISDLTNYTTASTAATDFASCENSKIIMAAGDKNTFPAAWTANEYSTEGTKAGDWCLPAAGVFTSYYNNQTSVNLGFERVNGIQFTTETRAWSSSEKGYGSAWFTLFKNDYGFYYSYDLQKSFLNEVRPVIEF